MMNAFKLFICLVLNLYGLAAQPAIQWQRTLGGNKNDDPECIIQTKDGGYILTGITESTIFDVSGNHGLYDYWVVKLNATGGITWQKTYGGSYDEWPYEIRQTADGGYIVAGSATSEDGDVSGLHGGWDAWILKLDSVGGIEWQRAYGGTEWEEALAIQPTHDGGYIFAGIAQSTNGDVTEIYGGRDVWVVKINSIGDIEWQQTYGGTYEDQARTIKQTADGGYIVAGYTQSYDGDVSANNGNLDCWVIKISSTGQLEWERALGGSAADFANDIFQTSDGGYIVGANASSHNSGDVTGHKGFLDFWLIKLSNSGLLQWQKCLGGSEPDHCTSIIETNDGMFVAFGNTESTNGDVIGNDGGADCWAVKLNTSGDIIWQKTLGGTKAEIGKHIQQTTDNGFILTGDTWSTDGDLSGSTNHGYNDFWVVKLAPETVATFEASTSNPGQLDVFPNPASQSVCIKTTSESSRLHLKLSDQLGHILLQQTIPNAGNIDLRQLPAGWYNLQAIDEGGRVFTSKIKKQL